MEKIGKILAVDDNEDVLLSLNMLLKSHVEAVRAITKPERIIEFMDSFGPDVIILDMNFRRDAISGEEGYEWLSAILEHDPRMVVLFITAYVDTDKAVRAIKAGAVDFLPKPWDKNKLLDTVKSAIELSQSRKRGKASPDAQRNAFQNLIGQCDAIRNLKQQIEKVASTDANVLITGENGTGKDVAAHAIHALSARHGKPFASIDLGCIPESLFESELFGHEKGAFTDARAAKAGRVEQANHGTLFLDEIGNLPIAAQQKLLTMIEKREMQPVGSSRAAKVDVRIISATNASLADKVAQGSFRQDLLYRINTIELHIPPLRERGNDIILLAEHFAGIYASKYDKGPAQIQEQAKQKLMAHAWPGNVRELQHCMERAVVLSPGACLSADSISLQPAAMCGKSENENSGAATLNLEELERNAIRRAVSICNGNLSQAAEKLGISRFALYRRIEKLGI